MALAGTLIASKLDPSVNDKLSSIAFNEHGMVIDEQLPMVAPTSARRSTFDEYLKEAGKETSFFDQARASLLHSRINPRKSFLTIWRVSSGLASKSDGRGKLRSEAADM